MIRDHVSGRVQLLAPSLLVYEFTNAVVQALRRRRITAGEGQAILASFEGLGIRLEPISWQQMWPLAQGFDRSAHDAAYLALAESKQAPLVTGDRRLYNAVRGDLPWVQWIGDT